MMCSLTAAERSIGFIGSSVSVVFDGVCMSQQVFNPWLVDLQRSEDASERDKDSAKSRDLARSKSFHSHKLVQAPNVGKCRHLE
jgi:hypothetical protein